MSVEQTNGLKTLGTLVHFLCTEWEGLTGEMTKMLLIRNLR